MADEVTVSVVGAEEVTALLAAMPAVMFEAAKASVQQATLNVHAAVLNRLRGDPMQSRSGSLARSIIPKTDGTTLTDLVGRVYSGIIYARIHEYGGVVAAKDKYRWQPGGPYLNIPTAANKTPAGVTRMTSTMVFAAGGRIRSEPEGFGLYLGNTRMFSFARRVTLKAQLGLRQAADNEVQPLLVRLNDLLQQGMEGAA